MLQRKMMQTLGAMVGVGLLGMIVEYLICGRLAGEYVSLGAIFSPGGDTPKNVALVACGIEAMRIKIFAGGAAGVLMGLVASALSMRISPRHKI